MCEFKEATYLRIGIEAMFHRENMLRLQDLESSHTGKTGSLVVQISNGSSSFTPSPNHSLAACSSTEVPGNEKSKIPTNALIISANFYRVRPNYLGTFFNRVFRLQSFPVHTNLSACLFVPIFANSSLAAPDYLHD